jgi:hypothetical protein
MSNPQDILPVLALLGAVYPGFELKDLTVEVYLRLLADLPAEALEKAALDHIARSKFFPTIAELRQAAFDLLEAIDPQPVPQQAWGLVQAEIERVGHAGTPKFEFLAIAQAVEALGWRALCVSDNPIAERAHFVQVYQAILERQRQEARRLPEVRQFLALQRGQAQTALPDAISPPGA